MIARIYTQPVCRGSIKLGTGCRNCERCRDELQKMNGEADVPVTPADFWSARVLPEGIEDQDMRARIEEMRDMQGRKGATFFRATLSEGRLWLEGWRVQPRVQGAFDPPKECDHNDVVFSWTTNSFTDRPGRMLSLTGCCDRCGEALRFVGAPFGVSLNRPTVDFPGTEIRLPFVVGAEKHVPGAEALARPAPEATQ